MLENNGFIDPCFAKSRRIAPLAEFVIEKTLRLRFVFFPPAPDSAHIMRRWCNYGEVRRICGMKEFLVYIFRHALYLKAENAHIFHILWHTMWHHPQVFAAYEHIGYSL